MKKISYESMKADFEIGKELGNQNFKQGPKFNEETVKFWMKQFEPRTKKWRADTMRGLKAPVSAEVLAMKQDVAEKIEALKRLK